VGVGVMPPLIVKRLKSHPTAIDREREMWVPTPCLQVCMCMCMCVCVCVVVVVVVLWRGVVWCGVVLRV
jgi:hypothetical protein